MSEKKQITITSKEAANIINCTPQHIRTLVRQGRLKAIKKPSTRNPSGYDYQVIKDSAKLYAKTVPLRGWPRGVSRRQKESTVKRFTQEDSDYLKTDAPQGVHFGRFDCGDEIVGDTDEGEVIQGFVVAVGDKTYRLKSGDRHYAVAKNSARAIYVESEKADGKKQTGV